MEEQIDLESSINDSDEIQFEKQISILPIIEETFSDPESSQKENLLISKFLINSESSVDLRVGPSIETSSLSDSFEPADVSDANSISYSLSRAPVETGSNEESFSLDSRIHAGTVSSISSKKR